jgi:hypothetical protein
LKLYDKNYFMDQFKKLNLQEARHGPKSPVSIGLTQKKIPILSEP